jgi:hypothetical protein
MNKTFTQLTMSAAIVLAAGTAALAQQAGGGPLPQTGAPNTAGSTPQTQGTMTQPNTSGQGQGQGQKRGTGAMTAPQAGAGGGQGNNATSNEKK